MPPKPALNVRFLGGFLLLSTLVALGFAGGYRNLRSDVAATLESNLRQRVGEVSRSLTSARGFYLERVQGTMRVLQQTALAAGSPAAGDWVDVEGRAGGDGHDGAVAERDINDHHMLGASNGGLKFSELVLRSAIGQFLEKRQRRPRRSNT